MRILGILCTLALFLFLIVSAPGYAQDRDTNNPNPPQDEHKQKDKDKAKPEDRTARPDEGRQNEAPNMGRQDERQKQPEASRPQEQPRPKDNDRRAAQDNGRGRNQNASGRGRRIPDDQFRSHFGKQHTFHVQRSQIVNVSQPVVIYGGYSFQLVDAWPADWAYDDDCYIDDVDGEYFLFDVLHPGIRIAVFIIE